MPSIKFQHIPCHTESGLAYQHLHIQIATSNGLIEPHDLKGLKLPEEMIWSQGVVLEGKAPIWLYSYLTHLCHPTAWVACFDPRMGGAVVTSTHSDAVEVGQVLKVKLPRLVNQQPAIEHNIPTQGDRDLASAILVCGPPGSGKSVLSYALRASLILRFPELPFLLHRANWDGEGNWSYETPDSKLVEQLVQEHERRMHINPETATEIPFFFDRHTNATVNLREVLDLIIVDLGGRIQPEKHLLIERCTHSIIISKDPDKIPEWQKFCEPALKPIAIIHSVLENRLEILRTEPYLEIIAGPWERGKTLTVPDILLDAVIKHCLPWLQ
jgi:CRISPR-associated protein Csx3